MNGNIVREAIRERGWTLEQTARYLGISRSYLNELVTGTKTNPTLEVLRRISDLLKISVDELLKGAAQEVGNNNQVLKAMGKDLPEGR